MFLDVPVIGAVANRKERGTPSLPEVRGIRQTRLVQSSGTWPWNTRPRVALFAEGFLELPERRVIQIDVLGNVYVGANRRLPGRPKYATVPHLGQGSMRRSTDRVFMTQPALAGFEGFHPRIDQQANRAPDAGVQALDLVDVHRHP